ncbi:MAG TPA: diacylglycerol kinase family protein [Bryobacteraceae bacterium]|nr:diacylglycerol kinase family protein [Bryobacteraceae bacterium]
MIYNPAAGGMRWRRGLPEQVRGLLASLGHGIAAVPTEGPESAGPIAARCIAAGADLILALGGDGTLNDLLPGVAHSNVPVGIVPAGTANVLARELGIGCNPLRAARKLTEWVPQRIALGRLYSEPDQHQRYFALMAGIGFDAHIVYRLNLPLKAKAGQFAYWVGSLGQLARRLDELELEVNGETLRGTFALVSRVRNYAGYLHVARRVSLVKPEFEVIVFEGTSAFRYYLKYLAAILTHRASNVKGMTFLRTKKAVFTATDQRVYVQVDGEYAGRLPASVEIVPDAMTLLVPPAYLTRP